MLSRNPTRFAGVLGWPLKQTLSPAIHNAAFRRAGLDWIYLAWPVPPEALGDAVRGLAALGAVGANVTMPHKETVLEHLDELSPDAEATGAVNTIAIVGGKLVGHNTDVSGFRTFLVDDVGVDVRGLKILVLGAGGAARAVVKAVADEGAEVSVAARRQEAAATLTTVGAGDPLPWEEAGAALGTAEVIVNATPVGMGTHDDPLPDAAFRPGQIVVDLVYDPPSTTFVSRARAGGAEAWGGIGMLVCQAADSFRIWTGSEPSVDAMSAAALHALGSHALRNRS